MQETTRREVKNNEGALERIPRLDSVRVFLLQPLSSEQVADTDALADISFTRVVLAKKGTEAHNAGQLMPVGGVVKKGETLAAAASRRSLDETHLILSRLQPISSPIEYVFTHAGQQAGRRAHFFVGHLYSPTYDKPYPLNRKKNKIESFLSLSPQEVHTLFRTGTYQGLELLDSLLVDENARMRHGTVAETNDIQAVHADIEEALMRTEVLRKCSVLRAILARRRTSLSTASAAHFSRVLAEIDEDRAQSASFGTEQSHRVLFARTERVWKEAVREIGITPLDVRSALFEVSTQEICDDLDVGISNTKALPTLHMMFPLLARRTFDPRLQPLADKHPRFKKLYEMTRVLALGAHLGEHDSPRHFAAQRMLQKEFGVSRDTPITYERLFQFFSNRFLKNTSLDAVNELGNAVDQFFATLGDEARVAAEKKHRAANEKLLSQGNEVVACPFPDLVRIAFSTTADAQTRFEAQRKLLLIFLMRDVAEYHAGVMKRGVADLNAIEASLETSDSTRGKRKITVGGATYSVDIDFRPKKLASLLRKVLVRDDWRFGDDSPYHDIFGSSYIFDVDAKDAMQEEERTAPCSITNERNERVATYKAPQVLHDFFTDMVARAKARGERIDILYYKGLPAKGGVVQSKGVGGGAKLRFAKCEVRHVGSDGSVRYKEIQFYFPKQNEHGEWVSGQEDFSEKKDDDKGYATRRLFTHGNVYSLIELLYPYAIFGDEMKALFNPDEEGKGE